MNDDTLMPQDPSVAFDAPDGDEDGWFSDESATFGDRLTGAREVAGLTQAELARRLGIKVKTLRAWEDDISEPRANRLSMVAGLLNVSIVWLLTGQGDGLMAPMESLPETNEVRSLLLELRQMRNDAVELAERMGRAEKALRNVLQEARE